MALSTLLGATFQKLFEELLTLTHAAAPFSPHEEHFQRQLTEHNAKSESVLAEGRRLLQAGHNREAEALFNRYNKEAPKRRPGQHRLALPSSKQVENALMTALIELALKRLTAQEASTLKQAVLAKLCPQPRAEPPAKQARKVPFPLDDPKPPPRSKAPFPLTDTVESSAK